MLPNSTQAPPKGQQPRVPIAAWFIKEEQDSLKDLMSANPEGFTRDRAQRYEELSGLIQEEDQRWLQFNEQLENLSLETT
jgi:hypothetical protein